MKVQIGKQKREIKDKSLFIGSYDSRDDNFQKRADSLMKLPEPFGKMMKLYKEPFGKRIMVSSSIDDETVSITFEVKEEYGDYVMSIYDCETVKDGEKHHYIGHGSVVYECKGSKDQLPSMMCKDGSPYYTVSVTHSQGVETIQRTDQPIYLFQAFEAIATAIKLNKNSIIFITPN